MTRERVAAYRRVCRSVELLERRIAEAERGTPGERERALADRLRAERDALVAERDAVRGFVDEVRRADELTWQIIEMYYMGREQPSLLAVATRMGWRSEFAPRDRLKRFFERVERMERDGG